MEISTVAVIATASMFLVMSTPILAEGIVGRSLSFADVWTQPMPDAQSLVQGPLKVSYGFFLSLSAIGGMVAGLATIPATYSLLKRFR